MQAKHMKLVGYQMDSSQASPEQDYCHCLPASSLHKVALQRLYEGNGENSCEVGGLAELVASEQIVLVNPYLNKKLRSALNNLFPRSCPLSIIIFHVSQVEHKPIDNELPLCYQHLHYHAPASFLEQLLTNVRRVLRKDDHILIHQNSGAALLLPDVDQRGAHTLLERIYNSISLLQGETVVPPLKRETHILLGSGTYPEQGVMIEQLLYHAGLVERSLRIRPAITEQFLAEIALVDGEAERSENEEHSAPAALTGVPFMVLPRQIPQRLRQLIPHHLALVLRCVPVGRDYHCLTVAMADPLNNEAIQRLSKVTGMTIFPVSCIEKDLDDLLKNKW